MLVGVMILTGRLVARETRSEGLALAAGAFVGTTSLMEQAGSWFSASQAAGAGFGVLLTLLFVQGWRQRGGWWRLVMIVISTWIAGGAWTTGHVAGPVAAVYLLADGRRRCVLAAAVPLIGTAIAVAAALGMGAKGIEEQSTTSFHGRKAEEAVAPVSGAFHTIQAIPERLIGGDLGLEMETTFVQGFILVALLIAAWAWTRRAHLRPNPLECAGALFVVLPYWILWTFRGYLPFSSLRGFVPWYETIPQIGLTLFLAGWWAGAREQGSARKNSLPMRGVLIGVILFQLALVKLNEPRVQLLFSDPQRIGAITPTELEDFPIPQLQRLRAVYLWSEKAERQKRHLARLDRAERQARKMRVGREPLVRIFGRVLWPQPPVIDDANLLDLPWKGTETDPRVIREVFAPAFALEPAQDPPWMQPRDEAPSGPSDTIKAPAD
jgi:hypothetical protein